MTIGTDKRGKQVFCSLKMPCVMHFMHCGEAVMKTEGGLGLRCGGGWAG